MTSRIDVFSLAVSRVVSGALVEAADLQNMDDDLSLEEARVRAVETIVEGLRIDIQEALGLLLSCGVLPSERDVYRVTPGLTPGYQAGVKKAAEVCIIQAALAEMEESP